MTPQERKVMELALEALERSVATCFDQYAHQQVMSQPDHFINKAITAIKEALAHPEQEQDNTYIYASSLATAIWQKHYMKESPKFALLDTTEGVLTQIDNMTCGLVREKPAQPEQEPVAIRYDFDGYGYQYIDLGSGSDWQTRVQGEPLYTTPKIEVGCAECGANGNFALYCVTCAEKFVGGILKDNTSRQ